MSAAIPNLIQTRQVHLPTKDIDKLVKSSQKMINDSFGKDFQSINSKLSPILDFFSMAKDVAELTNSEGLIEKIRAAKEQRESYEQLYGPDSSEDLQDRLADLFINNQEVLEKLSKLSTGFPLVEKL